MLHTNACTCRMGNLNERGYILMQFHLKGMFLVQGILVRGKLNVKNGSLFVGNFDFLI